MSEEKVYARLILSTEQIQQAVDRQPIEYEVPEWTTPEMRAAGQVACVIVRPLSVQNRDDLYRFASDSGLPSGKLDTLRFLRLVVVYGMITPQLTEEQVAMRSWGVVDRMANYIMEISGMGKDAAAKAAITFRSESGPAIPVPPGAGAPSDAG